jgi:hypothetical protein
MLKDVAIIIKRQMHNSGGLGGIKTTIVMDEEGRSLTVICTNSSHLQDLLASIISIRFVDLESFKIDLEGEMNCSFTISVR